MKKPFLRYDNPLWAYLAALVFLLIFSWSTSPLYLVYGDDSPFFQIIGLGWLQGKLPYVDLFDHKGPFIFLADAIGYSFGLGKTGLFLFQVINVGTAFLLFYKIAELFTDKRKAFAALALSMIPFIDFIIEGNQCEEWMLPWEAAAVYLCFKYLKNGEQAFPAWKGFVLGLIFSVMFYIRPNDGVMWAGGMFFGLCLLFLSRKQYRTMFSNAGTFLAAFAATSAGVFGYFASKGAVRALVNGMLLHNIMYAGDALFSWGGIGMILIPAVIIGTIILITGREGRREWWYVLIPVLVLVILFIGKRDYYHYCIPLMPFIVTCFAMCLERSWKKFLWIVCVLFAVFSFREWKCIVKAVAAHDLHKELYAQTDALFDKVPESERNNVWNYNLFTIKDDGGSPHMTSLTGAWLHKGLTPSNAAFVYIQLDYAYPESEYGIRAGKPEWVMMTPDKSEFFSDVDYIYENYELVASTPADICEIRLYRRKL